MYYSRTIDIIYLINNFVFGSFKWSWLNFNVECRIFALLANVKLTTESESKFVHFITIKAIY